MARLFRRRTQTHPHHWPAHARLHLTLLYADLRNIYIHIYIYNAIHPKAEVDKSSLDTDTTPLMTASSQGRIEVPHSFLSCAQHCMRG